MHFPHTLGALAGLLFLVLAIALAANDVSTFVNLPGLLIVLGGTLTATIASYPLHQIKAAWADLKRLKSSDKPDLEGEINKLLVFSRLWFRHQTKQIDLELDTLKDPFIQHSLQMIRDQQSLEDVLTFLNWRISQSRTKAAESINLFRSMATFAPAFGMVGSLVGLVNMLNDVGSGVLESMTANMAIALVTTFYGLMLANLAFKPLATKLEQKRQEETMRLSILAEGITLIAQGRTPGTIQDTLLNLIQDQHSQAVKPVAIPTLTAKTQA